MHDKYVNKIGAVDEVFAVCGFWESEEQQEAWTKNLVSLHLSHQRAVGHHVREFSFSVLQSNGDCCCMWSVRICQLCQVWVSAVKHPPQYVNVVRIGLQLMIIFIID